jgi:Methyltransferase domain/C-methyltransferase C-terminal domain
MTNPATAASGNETATRTTRVNAACQACGARDLVVFYEARGIPVHSCMLLESREAALAFPTGDLRLAFCPKCGFIGNLAYDESLQHYAAGYEEQQSFSPRFNEFSTSLATRLIDRYGIRGKQVVEIGCGKGDFLVQVCDLGNNSGVGIDPSYVPGRQESAGVRFVQDFYSERYANVRGDLVMCRHTLEHIGDVREFMQRVRRTVGERDDTIVFFEVPDVQRVLSEQAFWDIYYEHCSYFSLGSLARLFRACGFEVLDLAKEYDDQYLVLDARPSAQPTSARFPAENDLDQLAEDVASFQTNFRARADHWKNRLRTDRHAGRKTAIWGSGSKCVAFLSTLGARDFVDLIVDINPYRHGKFLAGSGMQIQPPESLREYRPDVVIAMNPIYKEEIRNDLERMGLKPELLAV